MKNNILSISNLQVSIGEKEILKGIDLKLNAGEIHVLMGPNGSGKSTLAEFLARKPGLQKHAGEVRFLDQDLFSFSPEQLAAKGLFLAFQTPIAIPGVSNIQFLKASLNAVRKARGLKALDAVDFLALVKEKLAALEMDDSLLYRSVNEGFSGGEKKRNEILQMSLLEPRLIILDEIDSGLDIDALKAVAKGIHQLKSPDRAILIITHYQRFLDNLMPDYVHILAEGKLQYSGDKSIALKLEKTGFKEFHGSVAVAKEEAFHE